MADACLGVRRSVPRAERVWWRMGERGEDEVPETAEREGASAVAAVLRLGGIVLLRRLLLGIPHSR